MTSAVVASADRAAAEPIDDRTWLARRIGQPVGRETAWLHAGSSCFQAPGGGEVQLLRTARHLEALGVPVAPFVGWTDRLERGRLLHLFGMSREGLELARIAGARGLAVALSPIFWCDLRSVVGLSSGARDLSAGLLRHAARRFACRLPDWRRELVARADVLLPNSESEADQLVTLLKADRRRIRVVPNGVDETFSQGDALARVPGPRDRVAFVGRVEPRKNLRGLIRALRPTGLALSVVGDAVPGHEGYAARCRWEGRGFVRWTARLEHGDPRLRAAYEAARVVALPSWFETPGLVALEAALAGCAVVVTPYGSAREYFGPHARYARPDRPEEIRRQVLAAWDEGADPRLGARVRDRYLWHRVAWETARAYDQIAA